MSPGPVIASLDFGTSSVKIALISASGATLARAQATYDTRYGPTGEVEQDPRAWWAAAVVALAQCAHRDAVVALAATGQMQDLIPVDAEGPIRNAILYSDTRAGDQHEQLSALLPSWAARTGNVQDSSNLAAKIAWLAEHEPETLHRAKTFLFGPAGYILWQAGGESACDVTTASSTGLLDVIARTWFEPAVNGSGARVEQLPRLIWAPEASAAIVGRLSATSAAELGLPAGIPLVMAMGDAGSTTDGLVGSEPSSAYIYIGTTGWFAQVAQADDQASNIPSDMHSLVLPGWQRRLKIGAVLSAGSSAAWALSTFLPGRSFAEAEELAAVRLLTAPVSRLLCLPGLSGERTPVRDNDARGAFVGVTELTDGLDMYLAVLTGVAMNLRHAADDLAMSQPAIALVGGAASSATWRRILADVFAVPVHTRAEADPGNVSAAMAAAQALGLDHGIRPIFAVDDASEVVTEVGPSALAYREILPAHRALYGALRPAFQALARQ